jgi:hypothetical protein
MNLWPTAANPGRRCKVAETLRPIPVIDYQAELCRGLILLKAATQYFEVRYVLSVQKRGSIAIEGEMRLLVTTDRPNNGWIETLRCLWCKCMHEAPMWPIHGSYRCRTCYRRHPVPWEVGNHSPADVAALVHGRWSSHTLSEVPK